MTSHLTELKHHYDFKLDLSNPASTHSIQFRLIPNGTRVLDVGCHSGILGEILEKQKQCTVTGIDADVPALESAQTRITAAFETDLESPSWAEKLLEHAPFDVILFGDVLEHTRNPKRIVEEAKQLLAPDGCVIVSVPNVANLRVRIALVLGNFDYKEAGIMDWGHLRFFTRRTTHDMMTEAGYDILREDFSGYSLPHRLIRRFPELLAVNVILVCTPTKEPEPTEQPENETGSSIA